MFSLLTHLKNPQNMQQVTDILIYFNNNHTMTEAEYEYKKKMMEELLSLGEDEIYNLLRDKFKHIP